MKDSRPVRHIFCCRTCLGRRTPELRRHMKRAQRKAERRALKPSPQDWP